MAIKKNLCRTSDGLFVRNLGWKLTSGGTYAQHKFYLGRDESLAKLASLRLEQLWQQVSKRWERDGQYEMSPTDRPVWDSVTFAIAEAIRDGAAVVSVPLPMPYSALIPECSAIGDWLDQIQRDVTVIKIDLLDEKAQEYSEEYRQTQGQRLLDMGRRMLHQRAGGETLHAAMAAYSKWIGARHVDAATKQPTAWGGIQTRQIAFLQRHLPDCSLVELTSERVDGLMEVLRLRPKGKAGGPVSVSWTQNCVKQFRRFLSWLNKSPAFAWKRPADLEMSRLIIPITAEEKSRRGQSLQVETYTTDELKILWAHASPFHRLLMLLGLNCGFGRAEVASLDLADMLLQRKHPNAREVGISTHLEDSWIFRVRHKTGVYGEFKLWPETVQAVEWWFGQRTEIAVAEGVTTLLVDAGGQRYDKPTKSNNANFQISARWNSLTNRIKTHHRSFRSLSFNKIRKTAGNQIRSEADGEIAAVFLCHGTPVQADQLLDLYTNRPFGKVFTAIERVGDRLRPLWAEVSDPFPDKPMKKESEIGDGTARRIQNMKQQGFQTQHIAKKLGLPRAIVRKYVKALLDTTKIEGSKS